MKRKKSFYVALLCLVMIFSLQFVPIVVHGESMLIIDCKYGKDGAGNPKIGTSNEVECGFLDAIAQIKKLINFAFLISVPITIIALAWSGIQIMLAQGNSGKVNDAKKLLWNILKGFLFIMCAWLIVYTITSSFLKDWFYTPFIGGINSTETIK